MVQIIAIILGFLFSGLCIFINLLLYKRTKKISLINIFIFMLIIFNGILPVFLINNALNNAFSKSLTIIEDYTISGVFLYYSQNLILLISTTFGWLLVKKGSYNKITTKDISRVNNLNYISIKRISIFSLILAMVSYYLYSRAYGGYLGLLDYTTAIRSGLMTVNNPFSFLEKFGGFSLFSTLLLSGLILDKNHSKKDLIWLIASISFSIYYLYSLGGRASLVNFFAALMIGIIFYKYHGKITLNLAFKVGGIVLGAILGLYYVTNIFARGSGSLSIYDFFIQELSFPFASFNMVLDYPGMFLFKHVILTPLYFLPSSIWINMGFDTASSFNTLLFMGARKGESGVTGSVPLDLLSFSWLQGGFIGSLVIGILFGLLLAVLQRMINCILNKGVKSFVFSYVAVEFAIMIIIYGDTVHVIQGNFSFIVGFCLLLSLLKRNTKFVSL